MAQVVNDSISTIRSAPATGSVIYIPQIHKEGHDWANRGWRIPDLDQTDSTKAMIVSDIVSGTHERLWSVIAVDLANGKAWDASEEIAKDVLNSVLDEYGHAPEWCVDFLERYVGIRTVNEAGREAA